MIIKNNNIFHSKALQVYPNLGKMGVNIPSGNPVGELWTVKKEKLSVLVCKPLCSQEIF
jgi:hypothetical protein